MAIKQSILKTIWKTFFLTWKIDRKFVIITTILSILGGLLPIIASYIFKITLDKIITISNTHSAITISFLGFLALRYLLEGLLDLERAFLYRYTQRLTRFKIQNYLNIELSRKISSFDIDHFQNSKTQDLIEKVRHESFSRIPAYTNNIFFALNYGVTLLGSFLALIPFGIWIPILAIAVSYPRYMILRETSNMEWSLFSSSTLLGRKLNNLSSILQREISVIEVRIAGSQEAFLKRVEKLQNKILENLGKPLRSFMNKIWAPILLEITFIFFMIYLQLPLVVSGILSIGGLTFLMQMFDQVIGNTQSVNEELSTLIEDARYSNNYFELMDLKPLVEEKNPGHIFEDIVPPKIEFQDIGFNYPNGTKVLKNITFSVLPGEHLAIVGPNGAGKSTLIKLLLRFYDPTKGSISINDFDLKDLKRDNWYRFIGTLFQNFWKYSLTVTENIAFSSIDNPDEEKVKRAAEMSGADEFIEKFPKKYDQQLGREFDGEELSVGQWQKLALARAFYEEAPVLILDEPTSAIDAEAEAEIFDNLNKVYRDKTVIFISHRFSTVRHADKIIVLKDGEIAEQGTHESLLKKDGIYARMFNIQAKGYIE